MLFSPFFLFLFLFPFFVFEMHKTGSRSSTCRGATACCVFLLFSTASAFTLMPAGIGAGAGRLASNLLARRNLFEGREKPCFRSAVVSSKQHVKRTGVLGCMAIDTIEMYRGPYTKPEYLPAGMAENFHRTGSPIRQLAELSQYTCRHGAKLSQVDSCC